MSEQQKPNFYGFGGEFAQTYEEPCNCGVVIQVSSQKDDSPEYYTEVCVRFQKCGGSVEFVLPVN